MRGGAFNCKQGRDGDTVHDEVAGLLKAKGLRFLALSEADGFLDDLSRIKTHRVVAHSPCGTALMVDVDAAVRGARVVAMGTATWPFKRNPAHVIREFCTGIVDDSFRIVALHAVPAPDTNPVRLEQYDIGAQMLVTWANNRPNVPMNLVGDWNRVAADPVEYGPEWVRGQLAIRGETTVYGTHEVMLPMARRCTVENLQILDWGDTDHKTLVYDLHRSV